MPFFISKALLNQNEKGHPPFYFYRLPSGFYLLSGACDANFTPYTYSLHNVSLSLHLPPARRSHVHLTTSCCSFSTLPCTLMSIYGDLLTYPPFASHVRPRRRLCSLVRNTPPAKAPHFLRGALFHFKIHPKQEQKRAPPPRPISSTVHFYALSLWLRCQLRDGTPSLPLARRVVTRAYPESTP